MRTLIVFGTTEGHTRALSQFMARTLRDNGHEATVESAGPDAAHPDPAPYDAFLLAASLHVGRYQPPLVTYARTHHEVLNAKPSAFVSVSLSAAGHDPDDWECADDCFARFQHETLWSPKATHHAGGAILYSQYDFFRKLAIKHIAREHGVKTGPTSRDFDMTDYDALAAFALDFVGGAARA